MGKKIFRISFILIGLFMIFIASSCVKKYNVTFLVDGTEYKVVEIKKNNTVSSIDAPSKEYYIFDGWYDGASKFDFNTKITNDITLNAIYVSLCNEGDHDWIGGDCVTPIHCSRCNEVLVDAPGHAYTDATCTTLATCKVCGETTGNYLPHSWVDATYDVPKTCSVCGLTEGDALTRAQELILNETNIELFVGETFQIKASVLPLEVSQGVTYSIKCNNGGDATVNSDGLVNVLTAGNAYVTVRSIYDPTISKVLTITIVNHLVELDVYKAFNIMTGFGTNASTDVEINYHTYNTKTYVEYTLAEDVNFNNASIVTGEGYYFDEGLDSVICPFKPRNVYRVSLTGLLPGTSYIYRINQGNDTYSEVYSFTTAKNDGSDNAFIVLSDTHYHAKENTDGTYESHGSELSEDLINKILQINPNVGFIMTAGDIVDTGGNSHTWDVFFSESNSLKTLPRLGVAGNHEYYISGTGQSDGKYQKAHYATPYNGPSTQKGLSGYVVYNGVLILLIDNEDARGRNELIAWMDDVLYNVEYEYSIAIMHSPIYYEDHETSNKDRDEVMMAIFEKHCVDLVIAGHYHGDRYRPDYYQGSTSTDPKLGVNYATFTFSGVKSRDESNLACGYLIETSSGTITIKRIDENGTIISTNVINTKRGGEKTDVEKEELLKYINDNSKYNEELKQYEINLSPLSYGNIERIEILETIRGEVDEYMPVYNSSYTKYIVKNIKDFYKYNFKVMVVFDDGTQEEIILDLDLSPSINLQASTTVNGVVELNFDSADSSLDYVIKEYEIYVNGVKVDVISYLKNYVPITSYTLKNVEIGKQYDIVFVAKNTRNQTMFIIDYSFIAK